MKVDEELLLSLIMRSMVLELAREANLLTRFNLGGFTSKIATWITESYNGDWGKAWDAFKEGRRPL